VSQREQKRGVLAALRRRGLDPRDDDGGRPPGALIRGTWGAPERDGFYAAMQRYSFRLVLRDAIRLGQRGPFAAQALTRHASLSAVGAHLHTLADLGLVRRHGELCELRVEAESLGPTLEWFVGEVLARELGFEVACGVPLRGGETGGDLDVVGLAEGMLLLIEVKSGPPKHVESAQVATFLDRIEALSPHGAIFFEDTELRMTDKIVVLFEEVLAARGLSARRPRRLQREVHLLGEGIYLTNAHPDVVSNLTLCVSHLLRSRGLRLEAGSKGGRS